MVAPGTTFWDSLITFLAIADDKNRSLRRSAIRRTRVSSSFFICSYLSNLINLNNLYLASNENIDGNSLLQIKNIIINCGVNSSIPSKYSLILLDDNTINLSLENQEINRENFILLKLLSLSSLVLYILYTQSPILP